MPEAYLIDAVRTPVGKRGGGLAGVHPADLAAHVIKTVVGRHDIDPGPEELGQLLGNAGHAQEFVAATGCQIDQQVNVALRRGVATGNGTEQARIRRSVPTKDLLERATMAGDRCTQRLALPGRGPHGTSVRAEPLRCR